jgi:DNA (cytosine-5)-methyltransferase 1
MDSLTHLDLCSGIGGFHLAAEWAGFETVGFSEIEPYCCKLLAGKWPGIKNYGDLRRADFSGLRGQIDVLSAGVPCQPASLAGKRRGKEDDRWLWPAVLDVVGSVEPAWCIFENPAGILTLDEFGGVLLRLESFGYEVRAFSVPANAVGAKHRRQRVFVVANRNEQRLEGTESFRKWDGINAQSVHLGGKTLADAAGREDRRQRSRGFQSESSQCGQESEALADTSQGGIRRAREGARGSGLRGEGEALADADRPMRQAQCESESIQPQSGSAGCSGGQDERLRFRFTEPPLCLPVDGVSRGLDGTPIRNRSAQLKALGNSVVPAQAYPFFEAIAQVKA